ncbi:MAG TPA: hypothetical protein VE907_23270 [Gammaproteobacteria bacterium]|nr:hypothetical protein [Gammaproteobacteria bacterium]
MVDVQYQVPTKEMWFDLPNYPAAVEAEEFTFEFPGAQPGRWRVTSVAEDGRKSEPSTWRYFFYQQ